MATFNHLPDELLPFIMRNLGIVDLTRCRAVCRRWRFYCDQQKVDELIIKFNHEPTKWYHTDKPIEQDNMITMDLFGSKQLVFRKQLTTCWLLRDLKRLKISSSVGAYIEFFVQLYKFPHLEQLDCDFSHSNCEQIAISHPNLRILYFNTSSGSTIDIDAAKLEVCHAAGWFDDIAFLHPVSIRKLEVFSASYSLESSLSSFVNLESLRVHDGFYVDPVILIQLSKLKELRFQVDYESTYTLRDYEHYSAVKADIISLIRMKLSLQLNRIQLYFDDVQLTTEKQFKRLVKDVYYLSIPDEDENEIIMAPDSDDSMEDSEKSDDSTEDSEESDDERME